MRVVSDIYRGGVVDNRDLLLESRARVLLLRDTASSREVRRRDLSEVIEYGSPVRAALTSRLSGGLLNAREAFVWYQSANALAKRGFTADDLLDVVDEATRGGGGGYVGHGGTLTLFVTYNVFGKND